MRRLVLVIILVFTLFSTPFKSESGGDYIVKNVVVIIVDTLAARNLGFMGYDRDTSPFMDELASSSVTFTRAYTPKSTTLPAVTSIFSSEHPSGHGVLENGVVLPEGIHFLTEDFRDAGFATWGIPSARVLGAQYGSNKGFDYYANTPAYPHSAPETIERIERILGGCPDFGEPDFTNISQPVFLMIHFYDPHTPFTPAEEYLSDFADPGYNGIVDGTWEQAKRYNDREINFDRADLAHMRDMYDAEIRTFDDSLRELFDLLDRTGITDNSLIVLTADHGENLGEHHFITHGHPYENSLHIPLLFHFPGDQFAGSRIDTLVEATDIMPTIMDIAGVEIPDGLDGSSMLPLIDPSIEGIYLQRPYLYAIGQSTGIGRTYSVFDGTYRLIVDINDNGSVNMSKEIYLFDITKDPHESLNLSHTRQDVIDYLSPFLEESLLGNYKEYKQAPDSQTKEMLRSLGYI